MNFNFIMILFYLWRIVCSRLLHHLFQFHYDLILFNEKIVVNSSSISISISLWSYSITRCINYFLINYFNFNFIMILFYCVILFLIHALLPRFQFHYDLILLLFLIFFLFRYSYFNFIMILFYSSFFRKGGRYK